MNILERVKILSQEIIYDTEYELYDVEYVKESSEYFLRIFFDKKNGLTLDDCVFLSEKIAQKLDEEDFIEDKYYLEVSSPGVERELRSEKEIKESVGKYVFIKTYEKIDNQKEFYGDLIKFEENITTIEYKEKNIVKTINIEYKKIAKIRLAVKF